MKDSICKFMPAKSNGGNIKIINFVYEAEFKTLKQPFFKEVHYIHLIKKGTGVLRMANAEYTLKRGDVFFSFPGCPYEISGSEDLTYFYMSFMGSGVSAMMEKFEIDIFHPFYTGFEHIIDFWADSIKRINQLNANILSESVLLYTMSFINNKQEDITLNQDSDNLFEMIVEYVDEHYKEKDMSLKKLTGMFPYSEKYLSYLFKKKMNVGFNKYLNGLRIQYANELIGKNKNSVSEIAALCGYVDPLYFSKVFKRKYGISPMQHIKDVTENRKEDALDYTRL